VLIDLLGNKVIKRAHATAPVLSPGFYQRGGGGGGGGTGSANKHNARR
jgi:hypothetical protein